MLKCEKCHTIYTGKKFFEPCPQCGGRRELLQIQTAGIKHDADKPRMDLLPFNALEEVAKVLTFGAEKYAENGWQKVDHAESRYRAALLRHYCADQRGEKYDKESGLLHAAHMATNAIFILWFEIQKEKTWEEIQTAAVDRSVRKGQSPIKAEALEGENGTHEKRDA